MAIYDWPDTRTFIPGTAELRVVDNTQRALESPMSGYVQTLSMPGARWGWGLDFAAHALAERDALEGFLLRLSGRQHRVRLWDLKRPRPRGTIATTGVTLGATAAPFAALLTLAGCRAAPNLILGNFDVDSNLDGVADGWFGVNSGTSVSGVTYSASPGVGGTAAQYVEAATLGPSSAGQAGVRSDVVAVAAGRQYSFSADIDANYSSTIGIRLSIAWHNAADAFISSDSAVSPGPIGWARRTLTSTAPAGAERAYLYVWMEGAGTALTAPHISIDQAQFEQGSATAFSGLATMEAGDWIGLANGQLVRCVSSATALASGAMTIEVRHMLRSAVASGSAVTLEKPTALYVRTEAGLMLPRMAGMAAPPMSVEFVEAFA